MSWLQSAGKGLKHLVNSWRSRISDEDTLHIQNNKESALFNGRETLSAHFAAKKVS